MSDSVTGLILAGGRSSRMGTDKGLVSYKGRLLVEHAIGILSPVCSDLLIATSNPEYSRFGYRLVNDVYRAAGPGAGIHTGLKSAAAGYVVVLSVDTPNITPGFFGQLLKACSGYHAVIPRHGNGLIEPLCGVYSTRAAGCFNRSLGSGVYKMSDILSSMNVKWYAIPSELTQSDFFLNINTKDDLHQ